ncbi:hypothetical protein V3C99_000565 [Haemonchus contortus]
MGTYMVFLIFLTRADCYTLLCRTIISSIDCHQFETMRLPIGYLSRSLELM